MLQTLSIIITGKVQGVFYRQCTKEKAKELNISGIVRNLPDDTVQIIASGTAEKLETLIEWCWKGPSRARVTGIKQEIRAFQEFDSFRIEK